MELKVALLIVYNHRYDRNIPVLENVYKDRFSHIYHLVPFYDGDSDNVIAVYDSSYYFQNYIAQAYQHIKNKGFTHYLVIADDLIVNPSVNELNLLTSLGITTTDCYISRLSILQTRKNYWNWIFNALKYRVNRRGVEIRDQIPSVEEARRQFDLHGFPYSRIPLQRVLTKNIIQLYKGIVKNFPFNLTLKYPLVGGYSDIFIVTQSEMPFFCKYCGAFAATRLFVEIAIPTSLALTAKSIKIDKDVKLKRGDVWDNDIIAMKKLYNSDLTTLLKDFPQDKFFLHPVKLSQWT